MDRSARFQEAIRCFDKANAEDPNKESSDGADVPKELLYARRMSAWLERLAPDASEALRLAARCQHIRRWAIPRSDYPAGREGYKHWRRDLASFHAETAGQILRDVGYDEETIQSVRNLLVKKRLKGDPECQLLEDVICLVFLENTLDKFSALHDDEKMVGVLRKTWVKMSPQGHAAARRLVLPDRARMLIEKALAPR